MKYIKFLFPLIICFGPTLTQAKTGLQAKTGPDAPAKVFHRDSGIQLAQATADTLSQSELKRILFYSGRVLKTIETLAKEDAVGGVILDDNVVALRVAVSRLVDAGKRSGLSSTQTADIFQQLAVDQFTDKIPLALQGASQSIDTRALFAGVANRSKFGTSGKFSGNLLDHLNAEGAKMAPLVDPAKLGIVPEKTRLALASKPAVIEDGGGTITERIRLHNGQRIIVVKEGDTLARYAREIYGDPLSYRHIFAANDAILASPNDLVIGTTLVLP